MGSTELQNPHGLSYQDSPLWYLTLLVWKNTGALVLELCLNLPLTIIGSGLLGKWFSFFMPQFPHL